MNISRIATSYLLRNRIILDDPSRHTIQNRVNLHYASKTAYRNKNFGDLLSPIIVKHLLYQKGITGIEKTITTKHLYACGSILDLGYQNATVWGSGILGHLTSLMKIYRKLDIRMIRGPLTKEFLKSAGHEVPELYGDPAILMPKIYKPNVSKENKFGIINHYAENDWKVKMGARVINPRNENPLCVIDEINKCEIIISSSLHGIIIAEAYGIPVIPLLPKKQLLFKYYDYFMSTRRLNIEFCGTEEEAFSRVPIQVPNLETLQQNLFATFPYDLYE
jgi:pyruvyltransferase